MTRPEQAIQLGPVLGVLGVTNDVRGLLPDAVADVFYLSDEQRDVWVVWAVVVLPQRHVVVVVVVVTVGLVPQARVFK